MFHSNSNREPTDQSPKPESTRSNSLETTNKGLSKTNRVFVRGDTDYQKHHRGPSTECHTQYQEYHKREEKRRLQKKFHKQYTWKPENRIEANKTWCGDPNSFSDTSELSCNLHYTTNIPNLRKKRLEKIRRLELEDTRRMQYGEEKQSQISDEDGFSPNKPKKNSEFDRDPLSKKKTRNFLAARNKFKDLLTVKSSVNSGRNPRNILFKQDFHFGIPQKRANFLGDSSNSYCGKQQSNNNINMNNAAPIINKPFRANLLPIRNPSALTTRPIGKNIVVYKDGV